MNRERYNRQLILQGFGEAAQQKLGAASVLVIGAGGLGCPALQYLAAAGVGHVGIADDDMVSLDNLHRQILYTTADIGKGKAAVAAERLTAQNPEIRISSHAFRLKKDNLQDVLKNYGYILDCTDNFDSRYLINDVCALLGKPLVFAAVSGYEGQLAIFNVSGTNDQKTNYRDVFPLPPGAGEVPSCSENGILGVLPGIIGTMQAAEAIKLITGIGKPLVNKLLNYNLLHQEFYEISLSPAQNSYTIPETEIDDTGFITIDGYELDKLQKKESTLFIDVREPHEFPALDKVMYQQVPMSVFSSFLHQEVKEENIVLICQHGIRSEAAAAALKKKYGSKKNVYSLKGGIVKWITHFTSA